ncbi:MAG TPA: N-methyl-L-tryptophan oxidase [Gemmatimonadaceae bacterium]|nr:N-methyl-L-tryptophan oxidase [Gemmatimonadaceae bacterium]
MGLSRESAAYDTIVVGLGAMGSATAYHLAARGQRVLGLEQFIPGHTLGSSHGDSRIIREQYFEHPSYVPLVQRAYALWRALAERSRAPLMTIHGGLMIGPPDGPVVAGTIRSAIEHGLPHEVLTPGQVHARFPAFDPPAHVVAVFDPHAGILDPDACNRAHVTAALEEGAEISFGEPMIEWTANEDEVRVRTEAGEYRATNLVLTTGGWTRDILRDLDLPLVVERQVVFWFDVDRSKTEYARDRFPIYAYQHAPEAFCYGFPRMMRGTKAAIMHGGERSSSPERVRRTVAPEEVDALRAALRPVLPELSRAPVREASVCLFTNTPDNDFLVDWHPRHGRVLISSPCSGHGFKFASALGEAHAQMIIDGKSALDLAPFRLSRFQSPAFGV